MLSTFSRNSNPEPKYHLRPGATYWRYKPGPHARRRRGNPVSEAKPAPAEKEIPASAPQFALETLAFPIDNFQQDVLATDNSRVIVCCCRQWGKSTIGAVKALHHALTNPGSLTLLASRTLRQTGGLLEKITSFARTLDIPIRRAPLHEHSLLLPNNSRIIALPGQPDSLRGFSAVSLLIIDEAAYVEDELYYALRPMLATTDGAIWLLSTPRNRSGFFYDEWAGESDIWSKFRVTAADCPRIGQRFLEEERRLHGPAIFQREYFCDFRYTGQSYFDVEALQEVADPDRYEAAKSFAFGRRATRIYVGFDLGLRETPSAIVVIECLTGATSQRDPVTFNLIDETRLIVRRIERFPLGLPYEGQLKRIDRIVRDLGDKVRTTLLLDATGCGQPFVTMVRNLHTGALIVPVQFTHGGVGSFSDGIHRVPKKDLLQAANYVLASPELTAEPGMAGLKELKEEMESYRIRTTKAGNDTFRKGEKDDLIMAFALASWRAHDFLIKNPGGRP